MDDHIQTLLEKRQHHIQQAALLAVEIDRANGTVFGIPHYSVIEQSAHDTGRQLSIEIQRAHANELVAGHAPKGKCPDCQTTCKLQPDTRPVTSIDGEFQLQELKGHCPACRRDFFPHADSTRL